MKFISDFFRRTPAPLAIIAKVPAAPDEFSNVETEISMLQVQAARLETEAAAAEAKLSQIGQLSSDLKVKFSQGDSTAAGALDSLQREQLVLERTRDGLRLRITALQAEIAPKQARHRELAEARDRDRQDRFIDELTERDEILAAWRSACGLAYDLMSELDEATTANIDAEHKNRIVAIDAQIRTQMLAAKLQLVNSKFVFARAHLFCRDLTIVPARPVDEIDRAAAG